MATGRELNINSLTLTDGQLAHTAPTTKQKPKTVKRNMEEEGEIMGEAAPELLWKLVRIFFMADMHELVHICHVGCPFFSHLRYRESYPSICILGAIAYAPVKEL